MLRVTLDSSAYISALQFNGRAARLLRMAADNDIEIAISEPIIAEVIGVLRERFGWDGYRLHAERERINSSAISILNSRVAISIHLTACAQAACALLQAFCSLRHTSPGKQSMQRAPGAKRSRHGPISKPRSSMRRTAAVLPEPLR